MKVECKLRSGGDMPTPLVVVVLFWRFSQNGTFWNILDCKLLSYAWRHKLMPGGINLCLKA